MTRPDLPRHWPTCGRCGIGLSTFWAERHQTSVCNQCRVPKFDGGSGSVWSDPCIGRYRTADYDKYLSSSEWRRLRRDALVRARHRCAICGRANARLEVHHISYDRFGGDERPDDLLVCCPPCHQAQDSQRVADMEDSRWDRRVEGMLRRIDPGTDPEISEWRELAEDILERLDQKTEEASRELG